MQNEFISIADKTEEILVLCASNPKVVAYY